MAQRAASWRSAQCAEAAQAAAQRAIGAARLLEAPYQLWKTDTGAFYTALTSEPSYQHPAGVVEHLTEVCEELYAKASEIADDVENTVNTNGLSLGIVENVRQFVSHLGSNHNNGMLGVRACADGFPVLEAALSLCDIDSSLDYIVVQNQVKILVIACRDLLVVRAQFLCPVGERALFEAVIEEAYGEWEGDAYSRVMLAYHKTLENLPDKFPSNNSWKKQWRPKRIRAPKDCGASSTAAE